MNTTLRALIVGTAIAAALTVTLDTVTAAERVARPVEVIRLDGVQIHAHRDAFDADGNLKPVRLDTVYNRGAQERGLNHGRPPLPPTPARRGFFSSVDRGFAASRTRTSRSSRRASTVVGAGRSDTVHPVGRQFDPRFLRLIACRFQRGRDRPNVRLTALATQPTASPQGTIMNTNLRALVFGVAVAAALTITLDTVTAAESVEVIRLEGVQVTAHRDAFDADGNLKVIRLDPVVVTAHKGVL